MPPLRALNPFTAAEIYRTGGQNNVIVSPLRETYSQHGEDLIIGSMLEVMIRKAGVKAEDIRYVDIGANHPIEISNTYLFYRVCGAKGVLFEADPDRIEELKRVRPDDNAINLAIVADHSEMATLFVANASELSSLDYNHHKSFSGGEIVGTADVPCMFVGDAFEMYWPEEQVQLLSVDIEGLDLFVIERIDFTKYRPWIVCAEVSPRGFCHQMVKVMERNGYVLVAMTEDNHIFAERERLCD